MASAWTFPKLGTNPRATSYAAKAVASSSRGSKRYVHFPPHDDRHPWPAHHIRKGDNPFKEFFPWIRFRWVIHDFRMFGIRGALRKHWYIGEAWRRKDEKIFCGTDENGNKFWSARRSRGSYQGRMVEPADPHWFRGQDYSTPNPMSTKWLIGGAAHTPMQVKARGEYGHNSRMGIPMPFNIRHSQWTPMAQGILFHRDPSHIPSVQHPVHPQYKLMREAGFSKFGITNKHFPVNPAAFVGSHDFSEELELAYFREATSFATISRSGDSDEWK